MNPVEKSRLKETCSVHRFITTDAVPNCWFTPKFPNAEPARTSLAIGGAVMKFTTPPKASAPYMVEPLPWSTSMRSIDWNGIGKSMLWCPVWASFMRKPSTSTRVCPKEAPRIDTSVCTPFGPRSSRSTSGSRRRTSTMLGYSARSLRTSSRSTSRSASLTATGSYVPVTTISSLCTGSLVFDVSDKPVFGSVEWSVSGALCCAQTRPHPSNTKAMNMAHVRPRLANVRSEESGLDAGTPRQKNPALPA